jgi:hypothetical protein
MFNLNVIFFSRKNVPSLLTSGKFCLMFKKAVKKNGMKHRETDANKFKITCRINILLSQKKKKKIAKPGYNPKYLEDRNQEA